MGDEDVQHVDVGLDTLEGRLYTALGVLVHRNGGSIRITREELESFSHKFLIGQNEAEDLLLEELGGQDDVHH